MGLEGQREFVSTISSMLLDGLLSGLQGSGLDFLGPGLFVCPPRGASGVPSLLLRGGMPLLYSRDGGAWALFL